MMFSKWFGRQKGVGLIEVLVATAVIGVGMTAVVSLQGNLTGESSDNKARAEAMAIAQKRVEELRNYTNEIDDADDFETTFATKPYAQTDTPLTGVGTNASFSWNETYTYNNGMVDVIVRVSWEDARGNSEFVQVSADLTWQSPRSAGDVAMNLADPIVPSPTGAAIIIGETVEDGTGEEHSIDDNTRYWNDEGNLKLVVGTNAVLLLKDACQAESGIEACTGFVTISGKVYLHDSAGKSPGEVYIKASNAAYCHLWYHDGTDPHNVTSSTTTNDLVDVGYVSASSQYHWFNYTCYLGAGWYGNIGVLQGGNQNQKDNVCIGDPSAGSTIEAFRRAYRGMKFKKDENGDALTVDGKVVYNEVGIRDEAIYPVAVDYAEDDAFMVTDDESYPEKYYDKHHFVLAGLNGQNTCTSSGILTESDAVAASLFKNNRSDFACLNQSDMYDDTFNTELYGIATVEGVADCPYNPLTGPATGYSVTGTVTLTELTDLSAERDSFFVQTSDGVDCPWSTGTIEPNWQGAGPYTETYTCTVYVWEDSAGDEIPWNGGVSVVVGESAVTCNGITGLSVSGSDLDGQDMACTEDEAGGEPPVDPPEEPPEEPVETQVMVTGEVSYSSNKKLESVTMVSTDGTGVNVDCTIQDFGNYQTYSCDTGLLAEIASWSGVITYTSTNWRVCSNGTGISGGSGTATYTVTDSASATLTQNTSIENNCN